VPIDHGLTIPDSLEIQSFDLAWSSFDQAYEPFSEESLAYIKNLKVEKDIAMLEKNFNIRPECLRNMKISNILLKEGAMRGLTLAEICQILCRPDDDETIPSLLEKIVEKAQLCANMRQQVEKKQRQQRLILDSFSTKNNLRKRLNLKEQKPG